MAKLLVPWASGGIIITCLLRDDVEEERVAFKPFMDLQLYRVHYCSVQKGQSQQRLTSD